MKFRNALLKTFLWVGIAAVGALAQANATPPSTNSVPTAAPELAIDQLKKCVVFLQGQYVHMHQVQNNGVSQQIPELAGIAGTGFLIFVPDSRLGPDRGTNYLVTNKHLIRQPSEEGMLGEGPYFGSIIARINTKKTNPDGTQYGVLPITVVDGTGSLTWFTDATDENLDLALIPLSLDFNLADSRTVPESLFATKALLAKERISENDEILFTGLFISSPGAKKNYPIVRHGKLARLAGEPIPLDAHHPERLWMCTWPM